MKIKLSRKFKAYNRERYRVELATSRYDNVPKEALKDYLWVKLVDVEILRVSQKGIQGSSQSHQ